MESAQKDQDTIKLDGSLYSSLNVNVNKNTNK